MENELKVQEIVKTISKEFYKIFAKNATLIWFGSWVKGNAYAQSDIDLAIQHQQSDNKKILLFQTYLSNFPTLYKIDLIDVNNTNRLLKEEIYKYGRVL